MANQINLQPQVLDLALYAGDGVSIKLHCVDKAGAPIDVNGTVKAQIKLDRTSNSPIVSFTIGVVDAYQGIVVLSLTGAETAQLSSDPSSKSGAFVGVWDIQWTPSGKQPRTLVQGKVECVSDVTR
jgi:hypothetical protein